MRARDVFINSHLWFKRINMFRALLSVVFIVTVSADGDMRKCHRIMRPESVRCCTSAPKLDVTMLPADDLKECMDIPMKPPSCEREECFAKKRGFYAADGGIDIKALEPMLEKEFKETPDLFTAIKEKCLNGDISKYGPPDMCVFMKMRHCIHVTLISNCPQWSDKDECSEVKGMIDECAKPDADMRVCHRFMHPGSLHCCAALPKLKFGPSEDVKECMEIPRKPHCCEREVCVAQKKGYYEAEGGVDSNALETLLEEHFGDREEVLIAIKENCLNGDLKKYGPPHLCDLVKMKHCINFQWALKCEEWSDEGFCGNIAKLTEECAAKFL